MSPIAHYDANATGMKVQRPVVVPTLTQRKITSCWEPQPQQQATAQLTVVPAGWVVEVPLRSLSWTHLSVTWKVKKNEAMALCTWFATVRSMSTRKDLCQFFIDATFMFLFSIVIKRMIYVLKCLSGSPCFSAIIVFSSTTMVSGWIGHHSYLAIVGNVLWSSDGDLKLVSTHSSLLGRWYPSI